MAGFPSKEQSKIINDNSDFLIVSAGPGAGKTQTLSMYILKIINDAPLNKKILVSSFTRNSTSEIKNRTIQKDNKQLSSCIFSTFDSFLINHFWKYYLNRIIIFISQKMDIEIKNINYQFTNIQYSKIKWKKFNDSCEDKEWIKNNVEEFIDLISNGTFLIGHVSEYFLYLFIKNDSNIQKYIKCFWERIIIDEAQDLSKLRYKILILMRKELNIKLTLIGDQRQTLYKFNGAIENAFQWIIKTIGQEKVTEMTLLKNFRYKGNDENIKNFLISDRNSFVENLKKIYKNVDKSNNLKKSIENLEQQKTAFILVETNKEVEEIFDDLKNMGNMIGAYLKIEEEQRQNIDSLQFNFVENLYLYKLVKQNSNNTNKWISSSFVSVEEIKNFLWPYDEKANDKFLKFFAKHIKNLDDIVLDIEKKWGFKFTNLWETFNQNLNYLTIIPPKRIQIMTIHAAKGLEADVIFIKNKLIKMYIEDAWDKPKFENLFVALSRVKEKIVIIDDESYRF